VLRNDRFQQRQETVTFNNQLQLQNAKPSRDIRIDTLRGIACVLLVTYHVIGGSAVDGMHVSDDSFWRQSSNLLNPVRMPLFAFITGVLLSDSIRTLDHVKLHMWKRLVRLGLPLLFVAPAFDFLACAAGSKMCVGNPLLVVVMPYAHFWFLQSSLLISVVIAFAIIPFRGNYAFFALAALPLSFGLFLYVPDPSIDVFSISGVAYLLPFTMLGIVAREHGQLLGLRTVIATCSLLLIVVCVYALSWNEISNTIKAGALMRTPERLLLSAAIVFLLFSFGFRSAMLAAVGRYAFAIFLFHPIFTSASRRLFEGFGLDHAALSMFALDFVSGILFPIVLQKLLLLDHRAALVFLGERGPNRVLAKTTA
jgi:peptidoglycan/LPS O-acetylase OafA/YrhL